MTLRSFENIALNWEVAPQLNGGWWLIHFPS